MTEIPLTWPPVHHDQVHVKAPGRPGWHVVPCDEWVRVPPDGDRRWRHFAPGPAHLPADAAAWDRLWQAAEAMVPWAGVVVGPRLRGDPRLDGAAAERLPGLLLLSLRDRIPGPLSWLHHEALHEVWARLPIPARDALEAHGKALRGANLLLGEVYPAEWFDRPGEAEAVAFQGWAMGARECLNLPHPADVTGIWEAIVAGRRSP